MKQKRFYAKNAPLGKWLLTLLLALVWSREGVAQGGVSPLKCGSIVAPPPNGSNPDSLILDRFGNLYDIEDLLIPPPSGNSQNNGTSCQSGMFTLHFDSGFPAGNMPTVCQVFSDLTALIVGHNNTSDCGDVLSTGQVNIEIVW